MLTHEAHYARPVPKGAPGQPALVGHGLVLVSHDRVRHEPAFPPGAHGAIGEVDVFAVEPEALVEPAELVERSPDGGTDPGTLATTTSSST